MDSFITNFAFLESETEWKEIFNRSKNSEKFAIPDDRVSFIYSRMALELIIELIYEYEGFETRNKDLFKKIDNPEFHSIISTQLKQSINSIRICGNKAVHNKSIANESAQLIVKDLFIFTKWFYENYGEIDEELLQEYNSKLLPSKNSNSTLNEDELKQLEDKLKLENSKIIEEYSLKILKLESKLVDYLKINKQLEKDNILLQEKLSKRDNKGNYEIYEIGITEQIGLIWGRVFINLKMNHTNYFAVKYFSPNHLGKATERFVISEGIYQDSNLFKLFRKQHENISKEDVINKNYDHLDLVFKYSKPRFGTPSILLKKLIINLNNKLTTNNMSSEFDKITNKSNYYKASEIEYGIHGPEIEDNKLYISIYHYIEYLGLSPRDYNTFKLGNYLTNCSSNYKECKYESQSFSINKFDLELLKKERSSFEDYRKYTFANNG